MTLLSVQWEARETVHTDATAQQTKQATGKKRILPSVESSKFPAKYSEKESVIISNEKKRRIQTK